LRFSAADSSEALRVADSTDVPQDIKKHYR